MNQKGDHCLKSPSNKVKYKENNRCLQLNKILNTYRFYDCLLCIFDITFRIISIVEILQTLVYFLDFRLP